MLGTQQWDPVMLAIYLAGLECDISPGRINELRRRVLNDEELEELFLRVGGSRTTLDLREPN